LASIVCEKRGQFFNSILLFPGPYYLSRSVVRSRCDSLRDVFNMFTRLIGICDIREPVAKWRIAKCVALFPFGLCLVAYSHLKMQQFCAV